MGEQIEVLIVGAYDAKLLARLREKIKSIDQAVINVVNVGTIGHVDHGRNLPSIKDLGELLALTLRSPEPYIEPAQRIGKGQRKANKANRWR